MNMPMDLFATVPKGMESLLAAELRALGALEVAETRAGARFSADLTTAYRVCLWSRVASRILLPLAEFEAPTPEDLYDGVRSVRWDEHLSRDGTLAVDFTTSDSRITHSHFGALKVKDAVVDQFRERFGVRPSVDLEHPDLRINVYLHRDRAIVSLDLSGESLHRRGYRQEGVQAPLKENLAAAVLLRAGWPAVAAEGGPLLDPMCGSGTLPIEAALMAADIAPGLARPDFGFLGWRRHDAVTWAALLAEARERREQGLSRLPPIAGCDADAGAVRIASANVDRAGLRGRIGIARHPLGQCRPPGDRPGLVAVNPPYGQRLGEVRDLEGLYAELGAWLKRDLSGWKAAVLTGNPDLGKRMGLRARRLYTLYNGPIECKLLNFEVEPQWFVEPGARHPAPPAQPAEEPSPNDLPHEPPSAGAEMFANRLRKNLKQLGRWARREGITCYRIYDADLPEYALAVDLYERLAHVQEYQAPATVDPDKAMRRLREALRVLPQVLEIQAAQVFLKVRKPQKGRSQYQKLSQTGSFHEVHEGGYRFLVNLTDYLDTGLFLDHRPTRALVGRLAAGRSFLNLFAYTGTATVYAAGGGARSTTSADMSRTYLDWARRNLELNGLTGRDHEFVQADCLQWLKEARARFGLIFLDPPTFSRSERMEVTFDVQRDHADLITRAAGLLERDGVLLFSTNFRRFKLDREALAGLAIDDITRETIPKDFERSPRIHQCFRITCRIEAYGKPGAALV